MTTDEARLVLGDALQAAGDPLGELVAVQAALEVTPDDEALLLRQYELRSANEPRWFGDLAPMMRRRCEVEYSWRLGFLDALTLRTGERAFVKKVLASAPARFLRRLTIDLRDAGPASLVLPAAPALQELEELEVIPGDQTRGLYSGLQGAECPKLETLTLWRVSADVLDYPSFETVKHVGLHRGTGLAHLPNLKALARLRTLDLSHGTVAELPEPERFLHLERLCLHDNAIDALHGDTLTKRLGRRLDLGVQNDELRRRARFLQYEDVMRRARAGPAQAQEQEQEQHLVAAELSVPEAVPFLLYRLAVATPPESDWVRQALERIGPRAGPDASDLLVHHPAHGTLLSVDPERARGLALHRRQGTRHLVCHALGQESPEALAKHLCELLEDDDDALLLFALDGRDAPDSSGLARLAREHPRLVPRHAVHMHLEHDSPKVRAAAANIVALLGT